MDNLEFVGPKRTIKKSDFVSLIVQALSSLGYTSVACQLEKESGVNHMSLEVRKMETFINEGDFMECCKILSGIKDLTEKDRNKAYDVIFRQCVLEAFKADGVGAAKEKLVGMFRIFDVDPDIFVKIFNEMRDADFEKVFLHQEYGTGLRCEVISKLQKLLPEKVLPDRYLETLVENSLKLEKGALIP